MTPIRYTLVEQRGRRPAYEVIGHFANGETRTIGRIQNRWFRHLQREGWQATASDGTHRSVHSEAWEAACACGWDGAGTYPFPVDPALRGRVATS